MDELRQIYKKNHSLHHAYLLEGGEKTVSALLDFLAVEVGVPIIGNPDLAVSFYPQFGIKESFALRERQARKPFGLAQYFIVETSAMTPEAQNALLKTFEEPSASTHFFLVVPSKEILLPTLFSRFHLLSFEVEEKKSVLGHLAETYLAASVPARLDLINENFTDKTDKQKILSFLNFLEKKLVQNIDFRKISASLIFNLAELNQARRFLAAPRANHRLILEHLSLILPQTKN